jgi:hypothetical protein
MSGVNLPVLYGWRAPEITGFWSIAGKVLRENLPTQYTGLPVIRTDGDLSAQIGRRRLI